jgi:putative FmdB family regulatory protein
MPIYEYKCNKCGVVEAMQRITEAPLRKCPNCKSKVERIMSRSSFVLKGTGWYATDYANKGKGKDHAPASEDGAPSSNGSTKGESQSESKTESKSEAKASTESKPSTSEKTTSAKSAD